MRINWNDKEPIYHQLRDRLVELILDGALAEGDPLPSVRQIASEQRINPITVSKSFQIMVDEGLVEKRRGLGMFVVEGAREAVRELETRRFLEREWPQIVRQVQRLGLDPEELVRNLRAAEDNAVTGDGPLGNDGDGPRQRGTGDGTPQLKGATGTSNKRNEADGARQHENSTGTDHAGNSRRTDKDNNGGEGR